MNQFEMVKLVVDLGLGASLLYLAIRFLRGGISDKQSRQLAALDGSLKTLVREAEVAGNNLNDQLLRRQQAMENTLRDLEANETRLQRSLTSAKELNETLEMQLKKVREELLEVERKRVRFEAVREASQTSTPETFRPAVEPAAPRVRPQPAAKPVVEVEFDVTEDEIETSAAPQQFTRVNIYGEPLPEPEQTATVQPDRVGSALQRAVEKIVENKRSVGSLSRPALDAVHAAAEEMLRAGKNLEAVAARTRLPLDEVRSLSQKVLKDTILQEPETLEVRSGDQRLGVLGTPASRRQEQQV